MIVSDSAIVSGFILLEKHTLPQCAITYDAVFNYRVSALDPLHDASPDERYRPRQGRNGRGRGLNPHCGAHPGRLVARNVGARRTAVGVHHHARRVAPGVGYARHPRDGSGRRFSRPDRKVQPSLLGRLAASRARRDWDLLPHPLGARTVEPATGPAPVVEEPEP